MFEGVVFGVFEGIKFVFIGGFRHGKDRRAVQIAKHVPIDHGLKMRLMDADAIVVESKAGLDRTLDHDPFTALERIDDVIQVSVRFLWVHLFIMP